MSQKVKAGEIIREYATEEITKYMVSSTAFLDSKEELFEHATIEDYTKMLELLRFQRFLEEGEVKVVDEELKEDLKG